jgi:hypothetical protein
MTPDDLEDLIEEAQTRDPYEFEELTVADRVDLLEPRRRDRR